jgi:hypothetical protein
MRFRWLLATAGLAAAIATTVVAPSASAASGGPHPTRWLRTVADNGAYGWMKDTAIYSETDPVRDCYPS